MYVLIQHDGTEIGLTQAIRLKNFLEEEWSATCELVEGADEEILLYDEDFKLIGSVPYDWNELYLKMLLMDLI